MSYGVGCRCGSDPALLWLWCRPGATAPIGPLAWEPPYAAGVAQEMAKRQNKKQKVLGGLRAVFTQLFKCCGVIKVGKTRYDLLAFRACVLVHSAVA